MDSEVFNYIYTDELPFLDGGFIYLPLGTNYIEVNIGYGRKSYGFNIQIKYDYDDIKTLCELNIQISDTTQCVVLFPYIYKDIALKWFSMVHKMLRV